MTGAIMNVNAKLCRFWSASHDDTFFKLTSGP